MTADEILSMFVAKVDSREILLKPFRVGDFVYASNGHWIARVAADGVQAEYITDKHPKNVVELFDSAPTDGFVPLPELEDPGKCERCNGFGRGFTNKCESCKGEGYFYHHDDMYTCKPCDGEGETFRASAVGPDACYFCMGLGVAVQTMKGAKVGEQTYGAHYLWSLRKLPGIEIAPGAPEKAARFRFEGGEGLLMPFRT